MVFSLTMDLVLHIVIRDMMPIGKEGKPIYFLAGALMTLATSLIFHSTWTPIFTCEESGKKSKVEQWHLSKLEKALVQIRRRWIW